MHKIVFVIALSLSLAVNAWPNETQDEKVTREKQRVHDTHVGFCAAYNMLTDQHIMANEVQKLAKDKARMAASGKALAKFYQQSAEHKAHALAVGKMACSTLGYPPPPVKNLPEDSSYP